MATEDNEVEDRRPLVLIHHLTSFKLPLQDRLITHFCLFDSLASPEASSVHALICVGPTPITVNTLNHRPSLRLVVGSSAGPTTSTSPSATVVTLLSPILATPTLKTWPTTPSRFFSMFYAEFPLLTDLFALVCGLKWESTHLALRWPAFWWWVSSMGLGRGRGFQIGFQVMGFWWAWAVGLIV